MLKGKIIINKKTDPKDELRPSQFLTDTGKKSFPTGSTPTERDFVGAKGTATLEEWLEGKKAPARTQGNA